MLFYLISCRSYWQRSVALLIPSLSSLTTQFQVVFCQSSYSIYIFSHHVVLGSVLLVFLFHLYLLSLRSSRQCFVSLLIPSLSSLITQFQVVFCQSLLIPSISSLTTQFQVVFCQSSYSIYIFSHHVVLGSVLLVFLFHLYLLSPRSSRQCFVSLLIPYISSLTTQFQVVFCQSSYSISIFSHHVVLGSVLLVFLFHLYFLSPRSSRQCFVSLLIPSLSSLTTQFQVVFCQSSYSISIFSHHVVLGSVLLVSYYSIYIFSHHVVLGSVLLVFLFHLYLLSPRSSRQCFVSLLIPSISSLTTQFQVVFCQSLLIPSISSLTTQFQVVICQLLIPSISSLTTQFQVVFCQSSYSISIFSHHVVLGSILLVFLFHLYLLSSRSSRQCFVGLLIPFISSLTTQFQVVFCQSSYSIYIFSHHVVLGSVLLVFLFHPYLLSPRSSRQCFVSLLIPSLSSLITQFQVVFCQSLLIPSISSLTTLFQVVFYQSSYSISIFSHHVVLASVLLVFLFHLYFLSPRSSSQCFVVLLIPSLSSLTTQFQVVFCQSSYSISIFSHHVVLGSVLLVFLFHLYLLSPRSSRQCFVSLLIPSLSSLTTQFQVVFCCLSSYSIHIFSHHVVLGSVLLVFLFHPYLLSPRSSRQCFVSLLIPSLSSLTTQFQVVFCKSSYSISIFSHHVVLGSVLLVFLFHLYLLSPRSSRQCFVSLLIPSLSSLTTQFQVVFCQSSYSISIFSHHVVLGSVLLVSSYSIYIFSHHVVLGSVLLVFLFHLYLLSPRSSRQCFVSLLIPSLSSLTTQFQVVFCQSLLIPSLSSLTTQFQVVFYQSSYSIYIFSHHVVLGSVLLVFSFHPYLLSPRSSRQCFVSLLIPSLSSLITQFYVVFCQSLLIPSISSLTTQFQVVFYQSSYSIYIFSHHVVLSSVLLVFLFHLYLLSPRSSRQCFVSLLIPSISSLTTQLQVVFCLSSYSISIFSHHVVLGCVLLVSSYSIPIFSHHVVLGSVLLVFLFHLYLLSPRSSRQCFVSLLIPSLSSLTTQFQVVFCQSSYSIPIFSHHVVLGSVLLVFLFHLYLLSPRSSRQCFDSLLIPSISSLTTQFQVVFCQSSYSISIFSHHVVLSSVLLVFLFHLYLLSPRSSRQCFVSLLIPSLSSLTTQFQVVFCQSSYSIYIFSHHVVLGSVLLVFLFHLYLLSPRSSMQCFVSLLIPSLSSLTTQFQVVFCQSSYSIYIFSHHVVLGSVLLALLIPSLSSLTTQFQVVFWQSFYSISIFSHHVVLGRVLLVFLFHLYLLSPRSSRQCFVSLLIPSIFSRHVVLGSVLFVFLFHLYVLSPRSSRQCFVSLLIPSLSSLTTQFQVVFCQSSYSISIFSHHVVLGSVLSVSSYSISIFSHHVVLGSEYSYSISIFSHHVVLGSVLLVFLFHLYPLSPRSYWQCFVSLLIPSLSSLTTQFYVVFCQSSYSIYIFSHHVVLGSVLLCFLFHLYLLSPRSSMQCFVSLLIPSISSLTTQFQVVFCQSSHSIPIFSHLVVLGSVLLVFLFHLYLLSSHSSRQCFVSLFLFHLYLLSLQVFTFSVKLYNYVCGLL